MNETITLSKGALLALIGAASSQRADDTDPLDDLGKPRPFEVRLKRLFVPRPPWPPPPPEDPEWGRIFGVQPNPWRSVSLARSVIELVAGQVGLATTLAGGEGLERAVETSRSTLRDFVDELCGTPPRWPWPWPWPPTWVAFDRARRAELPTAIDLLAAGAQLRWAADFKVNRPLQAAFTEAADKLLATGLKQLESQTAEGVFAVG